MSYTNCPSAEEKWICQMCEDYRPAVNTACVTEQYLLLVNDIFAALHKRDVYSTLDLRNTYNLIPLHEESKRLRTISTHEGLFCYNRLPFGVSSAPAIFQCTMEDMLGSQTGVQAYLDNVLVTEGNCDSGSNLKAVSSASVNTESKCGGVSVLSGSR